MEITLTRKPSLKGATLGVLDMPGFRCFTLEDEVREPGGSDGAITPEWVSSWKVPGETAIPRGRYRIVLSWSGRFQRNMPELLNVPGFVGIRIHSGNTAADTEGCIMLGLVEEANVVLQSRDAFARFWPVLTSAATKEDVFITVA